MTVFRRADASDAPALLELERSANLAALGHVFPPDRHPFPDGDVLARWALVLSDPGACVDVVDDDEDGGGLLCVVASDDETVRHVAVRPDAWGRGLGRACVERAADAIRAGGHTPRLWCLVDNHRARGLYEHLGWRATGVTAEAEWPPYPTQMEYTL